MRLDGVRPLSGAVRLNVVVLRDDRIAGVEVKSASDTLVRCVEQLDAYDCAFDAPLFVIDAHHVPALEEKGALSRNL